MYIRNIRECDIKIDATTHIPALNEKITKLEYYNKKNEKNFSRRKNIISMIKKIECTILRLVSVSLKIKLYVQMYAV